MPRTVQLRRGSTADHESFTGAPGEVTVDTDKNTLVVHDGQTIGGTPLATSSEATGVIRSDFITNIVRLFQFEYDELESPDPNTLYIIVPTIISLDSGAVVVNGRDLEVDILS